MALPERKGITIETLALALHECRFSGGLAASGGGAEFGYARFTRDYLQAMSDLMTLLPTVAREGFSQIPIEQGVKYDPLTEEEPDRLPHQVAVGRPSGLVVPAKVVESWRSYLDKWGVPHDEMYGLIVYNASDAVRYLMELAAYVRLHGPEVLDDQFVHRPTGEVRTVREAALRLMNWMLRTIEQSNLGLLEVRTHNPRQTSWTAVMRDGIDAYFHPEGEVGMPLNRVEPVAYIENQGLAVGALLAAAELFPEHQELDRWLELARDIPMRTVELFWMPEHRYFAPAIDRDDQGRPRQVKMLSSAPMELLATPFFDELPNRRELLTGVLDRIFDPGFMTPVGVRMVHLDQAQFERGYYAYQGTGAAWGVTQRVIAHGLRRQDMAPLAHHLGFERFVGRLNKTGKLVEYWYVERENGWVCYNPYSPHRDHATVLVAADRPQQPQLWTISGAMAELLSEESKETEPGGEWEREVCERYMTIAQTELPPPANRDEELHDFFVDVVLGKQARQERAAKLVNLSTDAAVPVSLDYVLRMAGDPKDQPPGSLPQES